MLQKEFLTKVAKFLTSGLTAAVVEYGIFLLLIHFNVWLVLSNIISFLFGLAVSFSLNKTWVFVSKGHGKKQLTLYIITALINLALSSIGIWLLVNLLHIPSFYGKIIMMGLIAVWNYVIFSRIIFVHKETN